MQVFIVGSPFDTAKALDRLRLNKQIIECKQILDALNGAKAWSNHPCTLQYRGHTIWLYDYMRCLKSYMSGDTFSAEMFSGACDCIRPSFHTEEYFNNMKSRLFTKNPIHYAQYESYGTSDTNMYYVDGEWRYYKNGKRVKESI